MNADPGGGPIPGGEGGNGGGGSSGQKSLRAWMSTGRQAAGRQAGRQGCMHRQAGRIACRHGAGLQACGPMRACRPGHAGMRASAGMQACTPACLHGGMQACLP